MSHDLKPGRGKQENFLHGHWVRLCLSATISDRKQAKTEHIEQRPTPSPPLASCMCDFGVHHFYSALHNMLCFIICLIFLRPCAGASTTAAAAAAAGIAPSGPVTAFAAGQFALSAIPIMPKCVDIHTAGFCLCLCQVSKMSRNSLIHPHRAPVLLLCYTYTATTCMHTHAVANPCPASCAFSAHPVQTAFC